MDIASDSIIAVIGAGTMGAGIAQVAASAGHCVRVIDSQQDALDRGRSGVAKSLAGLVRKGALTDEMQADIESRIIWTSDIGTVVEAVLAIEAIVERIDAKVGLFAKLAEIMPPTAILATNTSSLSVDHMAMQIPGPERFAGLHFFNPVPAMKLVEVVPGKDTSPALTSGLIALMTRWGKIAVEVRDVPGFIVNRVARPYYAEGFAALGEGISAATIDHALTGAGGFRMGPLALADLIGHDVNYAVARSVYEAYDGKTRFRPQPSQQALFDAGNLGRKSGSGVYDYSGDMPEPERLTAHDKPAHVTVGTGTVLLNALFECALKAGMTVVYTPALPAETMTIEGTVVALGDGRTLSERPDVDVLIDHARNFATASLLVVTSRNDTAAAKIAGFSAVLGKDALAIPDRPGQIVLRTLAQLANAAADAVADAVSTAQGIDDAMRFGANHPEGPLQWADRMGTLLVADALNHICAATGDTLYAPSPALVPGGRFVR